MEVRNVLGMFSGSRITDLENGTKFIRGYHNLDAVLGMKEPFSLYMKLPKSVRTGLTLDEQIGGKIKDRWIDAIKQGRLAVKLDDGSTHIIPEAERLYVVEIEPVSIRLIR